MTDRGPENDPDDVYRVAVDVSEQRSTFVVVRLRAGSLQEAQRRARRDVEQLCMSDRLDELFDYLGGGWQHEDFTCGGLADVQGDVRDYTVDIDKVKDPTEAELALALSQVPLPLEGD